jgi:hypothetical protein
MQVGSRIEAILCVEGTTLNARTPEGHEVVRRTGSNVWSRLGEEVVILDLESSAYLGLDDVAATIWELLERPMRVDEIESRLIELYDVDPDRLRADLAAFVSELLERGLVELDATSSP